MAAISWFFYKSYEGTFRRLIHDVTVESFPILKPDQVMIIEYINSDLWFWFILI